MTCIIFTVRETELGWIVVGANTMGPYFSRERAMDLAEGMVSAINATGAKAVLVLAERCLFANPTAVDGAKVREAWPPLQRARHGV
jgi:hypothetical protein